MVFAASSWTEIFIGGAGDGPTAGNFKSGCYSIEFEHICWCKANLAAIKIKFNDFSMIFQVVKSIYTIAMLLIETLD